MAQVMRGDPSATAAMSGMRALILVVERDPHVKQLEEYFLTEAGFTVEFADDGLQAIELARKLHPSIIITEILVPKCDGLSVCRTLKGDPATRHIIVLVLSILSAADRAREAGADGFLRKPLNDMLLVDSVRKLLRSMLAEGQSHGSR